MDGKDYSKAMDSAIEAALVQAGGIIEGQAVALVPLDTGRLKGSITYRTKKDRSDQPRVPARSQDVVSTPSDKWTLYVGSNVKYAPYIEYGTVRSKARPYLRPALHLFKKEIVRDFSKWVQEHLKRGK